MIVIPCLVIYFIIGLILAVYHIYYSKRHKKCTTFEERENLTNEAVITFLFWGALVIGLVLMSPFLLFKYLVNKK